MTHQLFRSALFTACGALYLGACKVRLYKVYFTEGSSLYNLIFLLLGMPIFFFMSGYAQRLPGKESQLIYSMQIVLHFLQSRCVGLHLDQNYRPRVCQSLVVYMLQLRPRGEPHHILQHLLGKSMFL